MQVKNRQDWVKVLGMGVATAWVASSAMASNLPATQVQEQQLQNAVIQAEQASDRAAAAAQTLQDRVQQQAAAASLNPSTQQPKRLASQSVLDPVKKALSNHETTQQAATDKASDAATEAGIAMSPEQADAKPAEQSCAQKKACRCSNDTQTEEKTTSQDTATQDADIKSAPDADAQSTEKTGFFEHAKSAAQESLHGLERGFNKLKALGGHKPAAAPADAAVDQ